MGSLLCLFFSSSILNFKTFPVLLFLSPSPIFPFHLLPFPVHPTGFSFYIFPGFLAMFILLSSNNNKSFYRTVNCIIISMSFFTDIIFFLFVNNILFTISCFVVIRRISVWFQNHEKTILFLCVF